VANRDLQLPRRRRWPTPVHHLRKPQRDGRRHPPRVRIRERQALHESQHRLLHSARLIRRIHRLSEITRPRPAPRMVATPMPPEAFLPRSAVISHQLVPFVT
jgi:hypothetical protein